MKGGRPDSLKIYESQERKKVEYRKIKGNGIKENLKREGIKEEGWRKFSHAILK